MKFAFKKWNKLGDCYVTLDLDGLMAAGVVIEAFADAHMFYGTITLSFPNGGEVEYEFDDPEGRQEQSPSATTWIERQDEAAESGHFILDGEFRRAYDYLKERPEEAE